ncbi:MAG: 3-methyl-2-oxobutanoate hydroxymethyltransferase [Deltaproteobacteria bacterium]|nr:3-methyl-2-oxobutanoate hydroxymethyltransferase [Deltaproteobacteria bacterium]
MAEKLTVAALQQMKRDRKKISAAITYDYQMAQILDGAGFDLLTVGDSVGRNMWGQATHHEVTVDQMVLICLAVSRGAKRAVVSCDMPFGPVQDGPDEAVRAAIRLVKEGHAEMVKVDNAIGNLETVSRIARGGIPVWTQFGFSPQSTLGAGSLDTSTEEMAKRMREQILNDAKALEEAGASMLDLTHVRDHSIYEEVARTARIPVLGGSSTAGPEADGRISGFTYRATALDGGAPRGRGNDVARLIFQLAQQYVDDVRAARPF